MLSINSVKEYKCMRMYSAFNLVPGTLAKSDPELYRLYGEFEKLFLRCE